MQQVAIIGHKTLLGRHLVKTFNDLLPDVRKNFWDYDTNSLDTLPTALQNCDLVFNLHDLLDLRIAPDEDKLALHNVQFVQYLLQCCQHMGCRRIVHLSTVFLQTSIVWPNVHAREVENFEPFREQCPFPCYCKSKFEAEEYIRKAAKVPVAKNAIYSIIARCGPLYGEEDRRSLICDAILLTQMFGAVPLVGDQDGTLQFTYAGNAAHALLHCAKKFFDEGLSICGSEMVLISDATPLKDIYRLMLDPIEAEQVQGEDESSTPTAVNEEKAALKHPIRVWRALRFPFHVFYVLYLLVAICVRPFTAPAAQMPGPYLFYVLFRNWTFFSNFKLVTFFRFKPPFDSKTTLRRSRRYYRQLSPDLIEGFSWVPSF